MAKQDPSKNPGKMPGESKGQMKCDSCGKMFNSQDELRRHEQTEHHKQEHKI